MKPTQPVSELKLWRNERLFHIDFFSYTLSHHSFPRHFHDHYVIEMVTKGADKFYCNGKTYIAREGQLVLINPGEVHTGNTIADESLQYYSLCPSAETINEVAAAFNICLPRDFRFRQSLLTQPLLSKKLQQLFTSFENAGVRLGQEELFTEFMTELITHSLPNRFHADTLQYDIRINRLTEYIREHFKEELSLEQMAALVSLNPFHLTRLFKKVIGISPYTYLLILRTEYAKTLLRKGFKVNEAAAAAGFYDSSHLHRLLRKFAAISPKSLLSSKGQYRTSFTA